MKKSGASQGPTASKLISKRIADLGDWRGESLGRMRKLIKAADPDVVEEWKWMGTPVWSHDGIICTGETYKSAVKLTFAKGASLKDPARLFNSSLDGNVRRAIDIREGEEVDASAFKALIRQAVAHNGAGKSQSSREAKSSHKLKNGAHCTVVEGTHKGKSGTVRDIKTSKTGHVTLTVVQKSGERFKTLARNVQT
jgi:hypothetical protein